MNLYNVILYLDHDDSNTLHTTAYPMYRFQVKADNFAEAAIAALKNLNHVQYSTDNLFVVTNGRPGWEKEVNITVRSLNKDDLNKIVYFYLWM